MKGYRALESYFSQVKIYINEDLKFENTNHSGFGDATGTINYKIVKINKITKEEEVIEHTYDIRATYPNIFEDFSLAEFKDGVDKLESAVWHDVTYTQNENEEIYVENIEIYIEDIEIKED